MHDESVTDPSNTKFNQQFQHVDGDQYNVGGDQINYYYLQPPTAFGSAPPQPSLVIGRNNDLGKIKKRIGMGQEITHSITIIWGLPGAGKTTLVAQLAHDPDIKNQFPDGVLWVSLGQQPELFSELLAWGRALGEPNLSMECKIDRASARLRGLLHNKRTLLIVDDIWQSEHIVPFNIGGNGCALLITTRLPEVARKIAPTRNDIYILDVLSAADALHLLRMLAPTVVAKNEATSRELVNDLGNLPLALQVAGRLLDKEASYGSGVDDLLRDIREGAALIAAHAPIDRADVANETTPSVAALLALSTNHLDEETLKRFALVGTFAPEPATFSDEAMRAVWLCDDPESTIRILVDQGLLLYDEEKRRYRMHAILAKHAHSFLTKIDKSIQQEVTLRHAQYYAEMLTQRNQTQVDYTWMYEELGQLRHVQRQLSNYSDFTLVKLFVNITENVALAVFNYGLREEVLEWCDRALHLVDQIEHNPALLLLAKGRIDSTFGNTEAATQSYQKAMNISDTSSLIHVQARLELARVKLSQGEYQIALNEFNDIAKLLRAQGNNEYVALVNNEIAAYYSRQGNLSSALDILLPLEKELHENQELMLRYPGTDIAELPYHVLLAIGNIYRKLAAKSITNRQEYYQKALDYIGRLHKESKKGHRLEMEAVSAHHLSWIHLNRGELKEAFDFANLSYKIYEQLNRIAGMADVDEQLGLIYVAQGNPEKALPCIQRSFDLRDKIHNAHGAASSMRRIAIAQFHLKQWRQSLISLRRSLQMYRSMELLGSKRLIGIIYEIMEWTIGRKRMTL